MTDQKQVHLDYNPTLLAFKVQEMVLDGWEIDPFHTFAQIGNMWECGFVRSATDAQLSADAAELAKPSRAEILAIARKAKAEKKAAQEATEKEEQNVGS